MNLTSKQGYSASRSNFWLVISPLSDMSLQFTANKLNDIFTQTRISWGVFPFVSKFYSTLLIFFFLNILQKVSVWTSLYLGTPKDQKVPTHAPIYIIKKKLSRLGKMLPLSPLLLGCHEEAWEMEELAWNNLILPQKWYLYEQLLGWV